MGFGKTIEIKITDQRVEVRDYAEEEFHWVKWWIVFPKSILVVNTIQVLFQKISWSKWSRY